MDGSSYIKCSERTSKELSATKNKSLETTHSYEHEVEMLKIKTTFAVVVERKGERKNKQLLLSRAMRTSYH